RALGPPGCAGPCRGHAQNMSHGAGLEDLAGRHAGRLRGVLARRAADAPGPAPGGVSARRRRGAPRPHRPEGPGARGPAPGPHRSRPEGSLQERGPGEEEAAAPSGQRVRRCCRRGGARGQLAAWAHEQHRAAAAWPGAARRGARGRPAGRHAEPARAPRRRAGRGGGEAGQGWRPP
ncbi:unnamed protein product, partial [Prorocentrum cordatum]